MYLETLKKEKEKRQKEKRKKNSSSIKKSYNIFIFFSKIQVYKKQYQDKDILKKSSSEGRIY